MFQIVLSGAQTSIEIRVRRRKRPIAAYISISFHILYKNGGHWECRYLKTRPYSCEMGGIRSRGDDFRFSKFVPFGTYCDIKADGGNPSGRINHENR